MLENLPLSDSDEESNNDNNDTWLTILLKSFIEDFYVLILSLQVHETNDAEKLQELMVRDDIAMRLYQSGFGNECLTVDTCYF